MPLRDHFHTTSTLLNWEAVHAFWPMIITQRLNAVLPKEYVAQPRLHVGTLMELDIGALERESPYGSGDGEGGVAVATWAPAVPMILLDTEFPEPSEYEVNVYKQDEFRLVAAIGLVSPSNKDRAENRQTFVNKCESLLKIRMCASRSSIPSPAARPTFTANSWTNSTHRERRSRRA